MYKNLLPLGSVVRLSDDNSYMIIGRVVATEAEGEEKLFDYVACSFPDGIQGEDNYFFDNEDIKGIDFVGYQDSEELNFRSEILGAIDDAIEG